MYVCTDSLVSGDGEPVFRLLLGGPVGLDGAGLGHLLVLGVPHPQAEVKWGVLRPSSGPGNQLCQRKILVIYCLNVAINFDNR